MAETYRTAKGTSIDIGGMLVHLSPGDVIHIERVLEPPARTSRTLTASTECICVILCGERFAHGHCMAFHDLPAVGYVTDPATLAVQRGLPFGELNVRKTNANGPNRPTLTLDTAANAEAKAMNFLNCLPKPDLDSRLIWAKTYLAEFREGSLSAEAAHFVWGMLTGWGQICGNPYEGAQYIRIANYFEIDLAHDAT
jgi:hypothetical protein